MLEILSHFRPKKGGNFPFFIRILTGHNLLILYEIGRKLGVLLHHKLFNRNCWWQPKRERNIFHDYLFPQKERSRWFMVIFTPWTASKIYPRLSIDLDISSSPDLYLLMMDGWMGKSRQRFSLSQQIRKGNSYPYFLLAVGNFTKRKRGGEASSLKACLSWYKINSPQSRREDRPAEGRR